MFVLSFLTLKNRYSLSEEKNEYDGNECNEREIEKRSGGDGRTTAKACKGGGGLRNRSLHNNEMVFFLKLTT